ncbi:hexosaminidase D isoform X2 [Pocillopora verrucosa]|uniref:hexosaminidase D isoform X2 n=1 Tax=Pocillopora verrucosa TaxID=203993 RepID=UPI00333EB944
MLFHFPSFVFFWVGTFIVRWSQLKALDLSQCNDTEALVKRLMFELSRTRREAYEAKVELHQTKEILYNITTKMHAQHLGDTSQKGDARKKFNGHKLVHLDLGGAPPNMTYLLQLLPHFVKWGATGLLIEYSDTFPYNGQLQVIQGPNAYSKDDITILVKEVMQHNLTVIPLVQTFGHLEFVLKHDEFKHLRETAKYTNSVCPKNPESADLVREMIDQVAALHPGIKWFHVGADEVWNLKTCRTCADDQRNKSMIFLEHMIPVLQHVRSKGITPIMWDDMMREWSIEFLKAIGKLAEPMIWYYRTDLRRHFAKEMFQRYLEAFPKIWTASAFKGATGPNSDFVTISKHVSNNLQWVEIMSKISKKSDVLGIALTGWSRYDHYGTLCELLPAGIPSLALCLKAIDEGQMNEALRKALSQELGFSGRIDVEGTEYFDETERYGDFPGHEIYELSCKLKDANHGLALVHSTEKGWMLERQLEENFLSYFRLHFARLKSIQAVNAYRQLRDEASNLLSQIYSNNTVSEWLKDKIDDKIRDAELQKYKIDDVERSFDWR